MFFCCAKISAEAGDFPDKINLDKKTCLIVRGFIVGHLSQQLLLFCIEFFLADDSLLLQFM